MSVSSNLELDQEQEKQESSQPSFFSRHGQKLVALAIWIGLIVAFTWYTRTNDLTLTEGVLRIINLMQTSAYGPLIYIILYALRPLTLFSSVLLTVAGGFVFGPAWGIFYTVIAANISATVAYVVGRYFGKGMLDGLNSDGFVQRWTTRMRENSFITVLIMRFIFLPYDLVNYLAGFLRIAYLPFILATIIGSIPGTIAFVLLGAAASPAEIEQFFLTGDIPSLDGRVLAISFAMFAVSLVLSYIFKRRERSQPALTQQDAQTASA